MYRAPFCHIFVDRLPKSGTLKAQQNAFRGGQYYGRKNDPAYLYEERSSCGCSDLAQDEVQIGAFTAKVYNAKAFWVGGTGTNSSNYITATARLTLDTKNSTFVSQQYQGMFVGTIGDSALSTNAPNGSDSLVASNMPVLSAFLRKTEVKLKLSFAEEKDFVAFKNGTPVKLTITINNTPGYLYLYWNGEQNGLVVTNAAPQA